MSVLRINAALQRCTVPASIASGILPERYDQERGEEAMTDSTKWTEDAKEVVTVTRERGIDQGLYVPADFARCLEKLCRMQHEALKMLHESKAMNAWGHMVAKAAVDVFAELDKELER